MVKSESELKNIINSFLTAIRNEIEVNCVILFGSYAKGEPKDDSDIDLAIVSKDFGKNHLEELQYLSRKRLETNVYIEAIPVSLEEFEKRTNADFVTEILKTGTLIVGNLHQT